MADVYRLSRTSASGSFTLSNLALLFCALIMPAEAWGDHRRSLDNANAVAAWFPFFLALNVRGLCISQMLFRDIFAVSL